MGEMRKFTIADGERGLLFCANEFKILLDPGRHWFFDPRGELKVERVSMKAPRFEHRELDTIVKSGALGEEILSVQLNPDQRALVWINDKFESFLEPGTHAFWILNRDIRVQVFDGCFNCDEDFYRRGR